MRNLLFNSTMVLSFKEYKEYEEQIRDQKNRA